MSDDKVSDPSIQAAATEAVAKAEAAATRRRWINLGEFVAVAGLIIGGVSLYLNYADRQADQADKQAEKVAESRDKARYEVKTSMRGKDVVIDADDRHQLGDVVVTFPSALGVSEQTSSTQTIPANWYERALLKATDGGADKQSGKLPVLVTVNYFDNDTPLKTSSIFDIVWQTEGHMMFGRSVRILAFKRHESGGSQKRIDQLWTASRPES
jgi:hypothetical protein